MNILKKGGGELLKSVYGVLFLLFLIPAMLAASEPLQVIIEGLEGAELKNVEAALALPPGLVQEGQVNLRWLRLFEERVPERVRSALEPFGYVDYNVVLTKV